MDSDPMLVKARPFELSWIKSNKSPRTKRTYQILTLLDPPDRCSIGIKHPPSANQEDYFVAIKTLIPSVTFNAPFSFNGKRMILKSPPINHGKVQFLATIINTLQKSDLCSGAIDDK